MEFFSDERRRALVYEEEVEERDEEWAPELWELFEADAFRSVTGITVALDRPTDHAASPYTAVHTGKTENRLNSTWIGKDSRN